MLVRAITVVNAVLLTVQNGLASNVIDTLLSVVNPDKLDKLVPILGQESPDAYLDFMQLAKKYGHPAQQYVVYTQDGYRLKVFRLPGRRDALPILLFHGIVDSSDTWIIRGEESLAIHLANAGYDVWLGNVRGNKYSLGHTPISLDLDKSYWNFTFNEHGVYDLPTTIDLVLNKTGASALNYIAHSQGTTMAFVLLSTIPEYNDKINLFVALAPVVYLQHSPPPLSIFLRTQPQIYETLAAAKQYQIFSDTSASLAVVRAACSTPTTSYFVCLLGILYQFTGFDVTQVEPQFSYVALRHSPTTTSTKNVLHFGQIAINRRFAQFDYGREGNLAAYGSSEPPRYKLENVRSKVVLLTARNDPFSTQADVAILRRQLPNVVNFVVNPRRQMNHLDYVWGKNMTKYLFPYINHSLEKFGSQ